MNAKKSLCIVLGALTLFPPCYAASPSSYKIKALYNSLEPQSISQHLAFYELYPDTQEGKKALQIVWQLLSGTSISQTPLSAIPALASAIDSIVGLINKHVHQQTTELSENDLNAIEQLSARLPNRKLKGRYCINEAQVLALEPEDVDLARGLLLSQLGPDSNNMNTIRSYEAMIDLMALQILARLPSSATPEEKIRAINNFIFEEMRFRFPPHSLYAKDIDLYTFLPSVLDSHKGVCLGVSILYLCLAQRLDLPLETITPPGHIYVRYKNGDKEINIETTARGIHVGSEDYLGIETRSLQQRNRKEVIGLAHFNQASVHWQQEEYQKAIDAYEKALPYLPKYEFLKELLAYNYLFVGRREEGEPLLKEVQDFLPESSVSKQTMAEDYLKGNVDIGGLQAIFMKVDETRESILKKRDAIQKTIEKYPKFRAGLLSLAVTYLQLHRLGDALPFLERYHELDPGDPSVEYYLSEIYAERFDYNRAWAHYHAAEALCRARQHAPKALKTLRQELFLRCPE